MHTAPTRPARLPIFFSDRFFYGWIMLPVTTIGMIVTSPGQTFGISMFKEPIKRDLGLDDTQFTLAYMLGTFLACLPQTYIGASMDRYGPRRVMAAVVILFGLACLAMSRVTGPVTLLLAFLLLRMLGQGALGLLSSNTLALWFNRKLGRVSGWRNMGMAALGSAVMPKLSVFLIGLWGWGTAYVALGAGVWIIMLPILALFFCNRPEDVGQLPDGIVRGAENDLASVSGSTVERDYTLQEAMRTRPYWIMVACGILASMLITGLTMNIEGVFEEHHLTRDDATDTMMVFGVSIAGMFLLGGFLADRVSLNLLLAAGMLCISSAVGVLYFMHTTTLAYLYAIALGAGHGLQVAVGSTIWLRYYGRAHLGKICGSIITIMVAASSIGPFFMGFTRDLFGSYNVSLIAFALLPVPMIFFSLLVRPPPHRPAGREVAGSEG